MGVNNSYLCQRGRPLYSLRPKKSRSLVDMEPGRGWDWEEMYTKASINAIDRSSNVFRKGRSTIS